MTAVSLEQGFLKRLAANPKGSIAPGKSTLLICGLFSSSPFGLTTVGSGGSFE